MAALFNHAFKSSGGNLVMLKGVDKNRLSTLIGVSVLVFLYILLVHNKLTLPVLSPHKDVGAAYDDIEHLLYKWDLGKNRQHPPAWQPPVPTGPLQAGQPCTWKKEGKQGWLKCSTLITLGR